MAKEPQSAPQPGPDEISPSGIPIIRDTQLDLSGIAAPAPDTSQGAPGQLGSGPGSGPAGLEAHKQLLGQRARANQAAAEEHSRRTNNFGDETSPASGSGGGSGGRGGTVKGGQATGASGGSKTADEAVTKAAGAAGRIGGASMLAPGIGTRIGGAAGGILGSSPEEGVAGAGEHASREGSKGLLPGGKGPKDNQPHVPGTGGGKKGAGKSLAGKAGKKTAALAADVALSFVDWGLGIVACGGCLIAIVLGAIIFAVGIGSLPSPSSASIGGGTGPGTGPVGECTATRPAYTDVLSPAQLQSIFGPPGSNQVSVSFFGTSVTVNKLVAPCLTAVEAEITAQNITYRPDSNFGGIGCLRNPDAEIGDASYHEYGAACDINPVTNPEVKGDSPKPLPYDVNCSKHPGNCYDMPPDFINAFYDHGFYWGGNWNSPIDYMHLEWHGMKPS